MFEVMIPSNALRVDASGMDWPSGQSVRYPSIPSGTAVTLKTYPAAAAGMLHGLVVTFTGGFRRPLKAPPLERVSSTRQGAVG